MATVIRPLGVTCNIHCEYCYQNPQRASGHSSEGPRRDYSLGKIKSAADRHNQPFLLFGGEPLLMEASDLEALWSWGYARFGGNSVQTNGTLITANHIRLFKAYNVKVGISVDGPGELNDARWAGSRERTRRMTDLTHEAIQALCDARVQVSLIVTLTRCNASADRLPMMLTWFRQMEALGISSVRLHSLEVTNELVRQRWALSDDQTREAFIRFAEFEATELTTLRFDVFDDMRKMLLGKDQSVACVWMACDPYTTEAVNGINGAGESGNCLSANNDGLEFTKAPEEGFERYLALYHTPQECGGCKGCRFFLMCKGQCPGSALDRDWRNRAEQCSVWKGLYEYLERSLLRDGHAPVSVRADRHDIEAFFLQRWMLGRNSRIHDALAAVAPEVERQSDIEAIGRP